MCYATLLYHAPHGDAHLGLSTLSEGDKFRVNPNKPYGALLAPPLRLLHQKIKPGVFSGCLGVVPIDPDLPGLADPSPFPDQGPFSEKARHDLHPVVF